MLTHTVILPNPSVDRLNWSDGVSLRRLSGPRSYWRFSSRYRTVMAQVAMKPGVRKVVAGLKVTQKAKMRCRHLLPVVGAENGAAGSHGTLNRRGNRIVSAIVTVGSRGIWGRPSKRRSGGSGEAGSRGILSQIAEGGTGGVRVGGTPIVAVETGSGSETEGTRSGPGEEMCRGVRKAM